MLQICNTCVCEEGDVRETESISASVNGYKQNDNWMQTFYVLS